VIARLPAYLFIRDLSVGSNQKDSTQLPGVALQLFLPEPFSQCPHSVPKHTKVDRIRYPSLKACGLISIHLRINQQGKGQVLFTPEIRCMFGPAVAHNNEFSTQVTYFLFYVTQLRDLLTAEQSTEVPYENKDKGIVLPETSQVYFITLHVQNVDLGEPGCNAHL
jgi:hypothetical protein